MNWKRYAITLLIMLLLGALVACQQEETPAGQDTAAPTVDVNDLAVSIGQDTVSAEGEVLPVRRANLAFQLGGTVAEVFAESGTRVAAGDPIVRLESGPLASALQQAQAGLQAAEASLQAAEAELALAQAGVETAQIGVRASEAQLALTQAGPAPEEVAAAQNNVAAAEGAVSQAVGNRDATLNVSDSAVRAAEAQVAAAIAQVRPLEDAYQQILDACFETPEGEVCPLYGPVEENTRFQLEAARAEAEAAQRALEEAQRGPTEAQQRAANADVQLAVAQRNQAQAQLDLLQAGARDEEIRQAEVGVDQARVGVEQAQVEVMQAEAAVTQAQANVVNAQAEVEAAQKALDRMTITAPFDGTVSDISVEVGELVAPGVPVVRFADFSSWIVETTDLTELDIVAVRNDLPATVTIDAIPGETINGTVVDIAKVSQEVRGDVTYAVTVALDEVSELPLRWGMTAFVEIDAE